jgi:hypothetical protein
MLDDVRGVLNEELRIIWWSYYIYIHLILICCRNSIIKFDIKDVGSNWAQYCGLEYQCLIGRNETEERCHY